eukprot:GHVS01073007.1.p1 GENE.GHVS01073007.1~~GHVS01073007.1.p1  ORF type:complete len:389 (+),score=30.61 GHVS01073007.1:65-1168(+)
MAADDQKVKRQDAAVASSRVLRTSSARLYGKNSLKVFWAIGLFFLLSSMERTTPAKAVKYPEGLKREIEKRENVDFSKLAKVNVYGNVRHTPIPAMPYLDILETAVNDLLHERDPKKGFSVLAKTSDVRMGKKRYAETNDSWIGKAKRQLCYQFKAVDDVQPKPNEIESITFEVNDEQHIWTPVVLLLIHFTDTKGRAYQTSGGLAAMWDTNGAQLSWTIGQTSLKFKVDDGGTGLRLKRFISYVLSPEEWTEMTIFPYAGVGAVAYGVYKKSKHTNRLRARTMSEGKPRLSGSFLYKVVEPITRAVQSVLLPVVDEEVETNDKTMKMAIVAKNLLNKYENSPTSGQHDIWDVLQDNRRVEVPITTP